MGVVATETKRFIPTRAVELQRTQRKQRRSMSCFNDDNHPKGEYRSHCDFLFSFVSFAPLRFQMPDLGSCIASTSKRQPTTQTPA
jgi:hypothetical protein